MQQSKQVFSPCPITECTKTQRFCDLCIIKQALSYQQSFRMTILTICATVLQLDYTGTYYPRMHHKPTCILLYGTAGTVKLCSELLKTEPSRKWVVDSSLFLMCSKHILPLWFDFFFFFFWRRQSSHNGMQGYSDSSPSPHLYALKTWNS